MKKSTGILIIILICLAGYTNAQHNTGDEELNKALVSIDSDAEINFKAFKVDIGGTYDITEKKLDYLSIEIGMKGGDIYMTVELARITKRSIDDVVKVYTANRDKGWGVIAKELGVKPGSSEFHALKGKAKEKGNSKSKGKSKGKGNN